jgi:hypothetical protein
MTLERDTPLLSASASSARNEDRFAATVVRRMSVSVAMHHDSSITPFAVVWRKRTYDQAPAEAESDG